MKAIHEMINYYYPIKPEEVEVVYQDAKANYEEEYGTEITSIQAKVLRWKISVFDTRWSQEMQLFCGGVYAVIIGTIILTFF